MLISLDGAYPSEQRFKVTAYTIGAIAEVLHRLEPPPAVWMRGVPEGVETATHVFAGYLMLDAWVANQDRHHENWGMISDESSELNLAPSFDHGASLARNISDPERQKRLETKDKNRQVPAFARRARSPIYAGPTQQRPMTTVEAWREMATLAPVAADAWLQRLAEVQPTAVSEIIDQIPPQRMSDTCRKFTVYLLEENRKRLLNREER